MKLLPFILSSVMSGACLVTSVLYFSQGRSNQALSGENLKLSQEVQELSQVVAGQNQDFQRQQQIIQNGANVAQKYGPPILRDMGFLVAEKKNKKIEAILVRQKMESFIPNEEQLKKIKEEIKKQQERQQQGGGAPAPATP